MFKPSTLILLIVLTTAALGQSRIVVPTGIHWQEINPDGTKYAVIEGDRTKPGTFTYAFFMPSGTWYPPHSHSADARVVVVQGTLLLGDGKIFDKSKARAIPAGSFFLVSANEPHWEGADGDTLIIGVGTGPWVTTQLSSISSDEHPQK